MTILQRRSCKFNNALKTNPFVSVGRASAHLWAVWLCILSADGAGRVRQQRQHTRVSPMSPPACALLSQNTLFEMQPVNKSMLAIHMKPMWTMRYLNTKCQQPSLGMHHFLLQPSLITCPASAMSPAVVEKQQSLCWNRTWFWGAPLWGYRRPISASYSHSQIFLEPMLGTSPWISSSRSSHWALVAGTRLNSASAAKK